MKDACLAMERELKPFMYEVDDESLPDLLVQKLVESKRSVVIVDQATSGYITERLSPIIRRLEAGGAQPSITLVTGAKSGITGDLTVSGPGDDGQYNVSAHGRSLVIPPPYKKVGVPALRDREQKTVAALAIQEWFRLS
jgi:hypothetical protein